MSSSTMASWHLRHLLKRSALVLICLSNNTEACLKRRLFPLGFMLKTKWLGRFVSCYKSMTNHLHHALGRNMNNDCR
ncbi:hypothetical protein B0J13DRAFT_553347 [Dactylonectria estremocensis]|uniref:Secreted protein n=1 Tax=Dactylonectria estremocensis TaxID=1079267 RepID=A0A9P9J796_9HYPO|nr:hypothetical protein B0J13DRAFT_553347 [Dactylonectria estremocensis]